VAWRKEHTNGLIQQLYKSTWENPQPEVVIESFGFVSDMTRSGPFLLAVTAEP
jgi:hypothetical protein